MKTPSPNHLLIIKSRYQYDPENGLIFRVSPPKIKRTPIFGKISKSSLPAHSTPLMGSKHSLGYRKVVITINETIYNTLFHRLCWFLYFGEWPQQEIDHIDGDKLNNKITNLRLATHSQNIANSPKSAKAHSSLYKGVCYCAKTNHPKNKVWRASIRCNHKEYFLGYFSSEIEAAKAYDFKAKVLLLHSPN